MEQAKRNAVSTAFSECVRRRPDGFPPRISAAACHKLLSYSTNTVCILAPNMSVNQYNSPHNAFASILADDSS